MPEPPNNLAKARFKEIKWDQDGQVQDVEEGDGFPVQFNPESVKLAYSSSKSGGDQSGGSAIQYVGQGTTKLSMDLIFDASRDARAAEEGSKPDVRNLTLKLLKFIQPKDNSSNAGNDDDKKFIAPGLRIIWGSFIFEGVVDSVNESLDFWTEDGRPLQAKISLSVSKQEVQVQPPTPFAADGGDSTGTTPMSPANEGDSVAAMVGRVGDSSDWKNIAAGNGIENPRSLAAGALVDLNAGISVGASAGLGLEAGGSASLSGGASTSFGVSAEASVSGSLTASAGGGSAPGGGSSSNLSARLTSRAPAVEFDFDLE